MKKFIFILISFLAMESCTYSYEDHTSTILESGVEVQTWDIPSDVALGDSFVIVSHAKSGEVFNWRFYDSYPSKTRSVDTVIHKKYSSEFYRIAQLTSVRRVNVFGAGSKKYPAERYEQKRK